MASHPLFPNVRKSPYFARTEAAGATAYMAYNHMYMPMDYGRAPGVDYASLTTGVTLWDVGAERSVELWGRDALALADQLVTRDLRSLPTGQCRYGLVCDEAGLVICDPVILRVAEDRVWLSHGNVDLLLWAKAIAVGSGLDVAVADAGVAPLQLQGPRSREVLRALVGDLADRLGYFRNAPAAVAGVDCIVSRTGWSGELGFELFPLVESGCLAVWDAVAAAGEPLELLVIAPNVPRAVEHGISDTAWFHNQGLNALELADGRLADLDAGPFIGRDALRAIRSSGPQRTTTGLVGTARRAPRVEGVWPVEHDGQRIGGTRWVTWSPALERTIAIAAVEVELARPGTALVLVHPDGEMPVTTHPLPFLAPPPEARA